MLMFMCVILETNHRQGKDKAYAELLNRVRVGKQTKDDMMLLRTRVRPSKDPVLKEADLYIVCKMEDCARLNNEYIAKLSKSLVQLSSSAPACLLPSSVPVG